MASLAFQGRETKHADIDHERNCCRRFDWIDGWNRIDDDAAGKTHETGIGKERPDGRQAAGGVLDEISANMERESGGFPFLSDLNEGEE